MADEIKFTQEELDQISGFQQRYVNIQMSFGRVDIVRMRLKNQLTDLDVTEENLKDQFEATQQEEQEFIQGVNDKYGDGVLDPQTGTFTPSDTGEVDEDADKPDAK